MDCNSTITVIHVKSVSDADEIHYLWDFTGAPSCMVLHFSSPGAQLKIDWRGFMDNRPNTVKFSKQPQFYFGVVLRKLYQYNDPEDLGVFDAKNWSDLIEYPMHYLKWDRASLRIDDGMAQVMVRADTIVRPNQNETKIGNITLQLSSFGMPGHDQMVPHLMHTENATQFDLVLDELVVQQNFSCSRFAVELALVSMESHGNFSLAHHKTLDDEFTPGIFEMVNIESPLTVSQHAGGYLQYRPVSYSNADREVTTSTLVTQTAPKSVENAMIALNWTIFNSVEGVRLERALVQTMNVSFGTSGDGCYKKTNYTTWTFVSAFGAPLPEQLSLFVVVIATIGLGVPLLLMVSGGCYLCIRRARSNSQGANITS